MMQEPNEIESRLSPRHDPTQPVTGQIERHVPRQPRRNVIAQLTFDQLHTFRTLVTLGSFRRTAERLSMSQPAVSLRIQRMETFLGTRLLSRGEGQPLKVTDAGRAVVQLADRALRELDTCETELLRLNQHKGHDEVVVIARPAAAQYLAMPAIGRLLETQPDTHVVLLYAVSAQQIAESILMGKSDLGLYAGELSNSMSPLVSTHYFLVLVARPPLTRFGPRDPGDNHWLERLPIARLPVRAEGGDVIGDWSAAQSIRLNVVLETEGIESVKHAVLQEGLAAVLPDFAIKNEVTSGTMEILEAPDLPLRRSLHLVATTGRRLSKSSTRLSEVIERSWDEAT
jgi:DNA-binding transcriptional LysR family regulator